MFFIPIHKYYFYFHILVVCLISSCSREPVLKRDGFPDKGEVFVAAYINNVKDNGLSIYGKQLTETGITAAIDTGTGFQNLVLTYNPTLFQYDALMNAYSFVPGKTYRFKVVSSFLNDSIIIEKRLPERFTLNSLITYPSIDQYYCKMTLNDLVSDRTTYIHDVQYWGSADTILRPVFPGGQGNRYTAKELPWIKTFGNNPDVFQNLTDLNGVDLYSGVRIPYVATTCDYIPTDDIRQIQAQVIRFTRTDYDYITSMYENVDNQGNPFFLNYQAKNIEHSPNGKIFGKVVGAYLATTNQNRIKDNSPILLKIFVKDKNGNDLIGNPNYAVGYDDIGGPRLQVRKTNFNYVCTSENMMHYQYDCFGFAPDRSNVVIRFSVFDYTLSRAYITNTVTIDLKDLPKDIVLNIQ